ncbi:acyl-CoA dehydrogenase/oxidase [Talaromyces proteolyticus]|uniref:Acyl-CoA dehydrogenase/oxidase n=1 Tax=Talaromyces proteolyticus TaxID=1131652 RepID=A0AAD4KX70_9EURO|nr:acyl-CoA dehydrogenase/oxidase [Talaromyces proteolyticus]KAH8701956.1 acyl-CoA dehydrogenase/oxidase [Talaromyces proteolyticus]
MSTPSLRLARNKLFKTPPRTLTEYETIRLAYERARVSAHEYRMTSDDVMHLTPKFWKYHLDMIHPMAASTFVLVTIQYNLAAGTIGLYLADRPDLQELMDRIMKFDVSAQFMLTELGHGLDAKNLETTATLLPDGGFDLHSPNPHAAKHMPPTTPVNGFPRVAVVIARLVVAGEDRGVRPFIVWLNDGYNMCDGITSKKLPTRAGAKPVDHAITSFNHVRLPASALLGSLEKPESMRLNFLSTIQRVTVGTLALSLIMIPVIKRAAYVAGIYSIRRQVQGYDGRPVPIISFRTQQRPILHALAQVAVFEAYAQDSIQGFMQPGLNPPVRHGIATTFKAVLNSATQMTLFNLSERCGAQGLFKHNHIIENQLEARGNSIAEGDVTALCIRLAAELLLGRYEMPEAHDPSSLLAQHEQGLFDECRTAAAQKMSTDHRSVEFNNAILPRCQSLVEAIGHRMAYEAALAAGIDPDLLALYEAGVIMQDSSWYVQHAGLTREMQFDRESSAMNAVLPRLEQMLDDTDAKEYVDAPILSKDAWNDFENSLDTFRPPLANTNGSAQIQSML